MSMVRPYVSKGNPPAREIKIQHGIIEAEGPNRGRGGEEEREPSEGQELNLGLPDCQPDTQPTLLNPVCSVRTVHAISLIIIQYWKVTKSDEK